MIILPNLFFDPTHFDHWMETKKWIDVDGNVHITDSLPTQMSHDYTYPPLKSNARLVISQIEEILNTKDRDPVSNINWRFHSLGWTFNAIAELLNIVLVNFAAKKHMAGKSVQTNELCSILLSILKTKIIRKLHSGVEFRNDDGQFPNKSIETFQTLDEIKQTLKEFFANNPPIPKPLSPLVDFDGPSWLPEDQLQLALSSKVDTTKDIYWYEEDLIWGRLFKRRKQFLSFLQINDKRLGRNTKTKLCEDVLGIV